MFMNYYGYRGMVLGSLVLLLCCGGSAPGDYISFNVEQLGCRRVVGREVSLVSSGSSLYPQMGIVDWRGPVQI